MSTVLVTGGAGFIGSHLTDALIAAGHRVRVLDALVSQVHGDGQPRYLHRDADFLRGDISDHETLRRALDGIDIVFHQAAEVGVGQSMYEIERYVAGNTQATAVLLQALAERRGQIKKLVVASSMSIYGEGLYRCRKHGSVSPQVRPDDQLAKRDWEVHCPQCGDNLDPAPTPEDKPLQPTSVYAITKQDQEQLSLVIGRAYGIPTVALRYFNVYGARQELSNPYTGVCAIFSARLLNRQPPLVFEDGRQTRDLTHVSDIVQANLRALETDRADYAAVNVGTGVATSVGEVAGLLAAGLDTPIAPEFLGKYRAGDIRHCVADITRGREWLGYEPRVSLRDGVPELLAWVRQQSATDSVRQATSELESRALVR